jgi:hypothetical protein
MHVVEQPEEASGKNDSLHTNDEDSILVDFTDIQQQASSQQQQQTLNTSSSSSNNELQQIQNQQYYYIQSLLQEIDRLRSELDKLTFEVNPHFLSNINLSKKFFYLFEI